MSALLKILVKLIEAKLEKTGIEQLILKNQNYITEAKQVWNEINENFRISTTVAEKLKSKADEFDKMLLAKFPELTQDDVTSLRQSIAGEINKDKAAVIDNSTIIKQLQDTNTQLTSENASLKDQLSKVQSLISVVTDNNKASVENNIAQPVQS